MRKVLCRMTPALAVASLGLALARPPCPASAAAVPPGPAPSCVAPADPPRAGAAPLPAAPGFPPSRGGEPHLEWRLHKTPDGAHPDGREQQVLWLVNRARAAPREEGRRLATSDEPAVAAARAAFGVDVALLQREFAGYAPAPPAAFDARLHAAALAHARDLVSGAAQGHAGQLARVAAAGFRWRAFRGTVLTGAPTTETAHAAFAIDWGPDAPDDGDGMQAGRQHRFGVLSLDGDYANAGIAVVEDDPSASGPLVVVEDFCAADPSVPDHFNRFIVGTVWGDADADGVYDPGEGVGGVTVKPDAGPYYAVTGAAGGYAIPVGGGCTYRVTFSGAASAERTVVVGAASALLDLELHGPARRPAGAPGPGSP